MPLHWKYIILESPYRGSSELLRFRNILYARCCVRHCLSMGESPLASHLLYTQEGILDDSIPQERDLGMMAGSAWRRFADYTVHYTDFGISHGMMWAKHQIGIHQDRTLPTEFWSERLHSIVAQILAEYDPNSPPEG